MALAVFSFNDSKSMGKWEGFTFKWYQSLFQDERIMTALFYTIVIAVVASLVATIIGTITAIGIHNMKRGKLKKVILNVNNLPILNPDVVTGVSLMTLFVFLNVEFGFKTILLSHIVFNIPYVILSVLPKLKQLPPNIEDAAMDLGATPMYALKKVVIPQIKPGIISGMLIAFTMSIDDFVISFFTAGNGVTNLSIEIYSMTRRGISPEINALSTIMFVVVLILLILSNVSGKKQPVLNKE
nr:ABC transporter permease [Romboutsia sp. 1001713B170207_170306_H8]